MKTVTPDVLAMRQRRNYNEVFVVRDYIYFCHNIHNLFQILFFSFTFLNASG